MRIVAALLLLPLIASAQTIVTVPAQSCTAVVTCKSTQVTIPAGTTTPPVVTPPVVTPPAKGTFYIFNAGVATNGNLDYSYGNQPWSLKYGTTVLLKGDAAWQPRMPNDNLDTKPYTKLTVKIRPTQPSTFISGMEMIGDVPIPGSKPGGVNIMQYGPNPMVIGQWNTYVIPLSAYGNLPGLDIYKVSFQHQAGPGVNLATDSTEFDALGFVP